MKASNKNKLGKIEKNKKVKQGDCIFPFDYKWKTHEECLPTEKGDICATSVNDKNTLLTYGYCIENSDDNLMEITIKEKEYQPISPRKIGSPYIKENEITENEITEKIILKDNSKKNTTMKNIPKSPRKIGSPYITENKIEKNVEKKTEIKPQNETLIMEVKSKKRYNEDFIKIMEELADITGRQGEPFKSRAYKKAAETLMTIDDDIDNLEMLKDKPGIGKTILEKLGEYMKTNTLRILERERKNPVNLFTKIYGVGPKKAESLIKEGIDSIEKLKQNKEKLNDTQKIGLEYYEELQKRIPRSEIDLYAEKLNLIFNSIKDEVPGSEFSIVGSYRRGAENSGDIDVIITNKENNKKIFDLFLDKLIKDDILIEILSRGKNKSLTIGKLPDHIPRRLDFLYSDYDEYPFAILYFTGSKSFNTNMRQHALKLGYSLNEHGFSKMDGKKKEKLDKKFLSEKEIFDFLNMEYKEPNQRIDNRSIILKQPETITVSITETETKAETKPETKPETKQPVITEKKQIESDILDVEKLKPVVITKEKSPKNKTLKNKFNLKNSIQDIIKDGIVAIQLLNQKQLEKILKKANDAYYNDKPIFGDNIYDIIKEYVEKKYPKSEIVSEIGAPIVEKNKVTLPYFMASMDKIKPNTNAINGYIEKYSGPYVISAKLDGVSALYTTEENKAKLFTRGNGKVGQDISYLIPYLNLPVVKDASVRGELIIKKNTFLEKYQEKFSNARNMVSGIVNQKKLEKNKFNDIDFVAYEVIKPTLTPSNQMDYLKANLFNTVRNQEETKISNDLLSALLVSWRNEYEYEIDGIIVTNDKIYERKNENPAHAFAFKMVLSDQVAEAKVINIIWTASKDGYLKPTIEIEPVVLGGSTIRHATAFNAAFVEGNNLGIGSIIELVRSGDVIPHILKVRNDNSIKAKMPDVLYKWNETHVDIMLENPDKDIDVIESNIKFFFADGLEVPRLGEGNIKKLVKAGFNSIEKIIKMEKEDFLKVENFGKKTAEQIYNSIKEKLNKASLEKIMAVSNIFGRGFGQKKINSILEIYPDILTQDESLLEKEKKLLMVKGMAEKSSKKFVTNISKFIKFLDDIGYSFKLEKPKKTNNESNHELFKKKILFTGFRDKQLMDKLTLLGAVLDNSVGKTTDFVIVKDEEGKMTTKAEKAMEKNIPVILVDDFKTKFNL